MVFFAKQHQKTLPSWRPGLAVMLLAQMAGGGSLGANADPRSGPYPSAGDSSAGNTMSSANTLGFGQAMPPSVGAPDGALAKAPDGAIGAPATPATNPPDRNARRPRQQ